PSGLGTYTHTKVSGSSFSKGENLQILILYLVEVHVNTGQQKFLACVFCG
ncbi:1480_t:CDS:1, partial [Gigaspora margarita]